MRISETYSPTADATAYHGDCLEMLGSIPDGRAKLIVTSPPYNIGKAYEQRSAVQNYIAWQEEVIKECHRILAKTGSICWQVGNYVDNGSILPIDILLHPIFERLGMKMRNRIIWHFEHGLHCAQRLSGRYEVIVWYTKTDDYTFHLDPIRVPQKYPGKKSFKGPNAGKPSCNPLGKNPGDVWVIPNVKSNHVEKAGHPCQFPVELVERLIVALTNKNDLVVDPFMGARHHASRGDSQRPQDHRRRDLRRILCDCARPDETGSRGHARDQAQEHPRFRSEERRQKPDDRALARAMRIAEIYSHLNGLEFLKVHKRKLWKEVQTVIGNVDAAKCKTKVSKEKTMMGEILFSPTEMNVCFCAELRNLQWFESRVSYWVTKDTKLIRKTMPLSAKEQKAEIEAAGEEAIFSYNQTDFVKDRVAVEVQFGKYSFVAYDLFVKHLAFYARDEIDVGIEILAMKEMQKSMSSGPAYYEGELYNILRNGRGVPGVPLVIVGVIP